MRVWLLIALWLCLLAIQSRADLPDTVYLKQVDVTAKAVVATHINRLQLLDSMMVQTTKTLALSEVLGLNSPVFIRENGYGGLATASFRGTTANHTLVLWNGALINGPQLGQVDFSTIPVFLIDHLSVQAGAGDIHSRPGIGGVVTVKNQPEMGKKLSLSLVQSVGSYASFGSFGGFSLSNGRVQARLRAFRKSSRNNFEYLNTALWPKQKMENRDAQYAVDGFQQELYYRRDKSLMSFVSWNQWDYRNLPPIMTNVDRGGQPEEYQNSRFSRNVLSWRYFAGQTLVNVRTNLLFDNQHYFLKTTSSYPPYSVVSLIDSRNKSAVWQNHFSVVRHIQQHTIEASFQYDRERVVSNNLPERMRRHFFALSASAESSFDRGINLSFGLRFDRMNRNKGSLSPTAAITLNPKNRPAWSFGISGGRVQRFATMNDLYWFPGGNSDLLPENALQSSLFACWRMQQKSFTAETRITTHASLIRNWIQWRPSSFRYWIPENLARVFARGFEVFQSVAYSKTHWHLQMKAHYAFTLTTDEGKAAQQQHYAGKQLIYIPTHHANINVRVDYKKIYLNCTSELIGKRRTTYDDDLDVFGFLPAYQLVNLGIGYSWQNLHLDIKVNNVFDVDYQAVMWRPMPGRNLELVVSYLFDKYLQK